MKQLLEEVERGKDSSLAPEHGVHAEEPDWEEKVISFTGHTHTASSIKSGRGIRSKSRNAKTAMACRRKVRQSLVRTVRQAKIEPCTGSGGRKNEVTVLANFGQLELRAGVRC